MSYRLDTNYGRLWSNFIDYLDSKDPDGWGVTLNDNLAPFNGRDVPNTSLIEFDTEEYAIIFKLRFS